LLAGETAGARGLVVVHAGLVPGVTTLAAADLLERHPEADLVEVAFTVASTGTAGPAGAEFVYRKLTAGDRRPLFRVPLPAPFGARRCLDVGMDAEGWLSGLANGRRTRCGLCVAERARHGALLAANFLGLLGRLPRVLVVRRRGPLPTAPSREPICEWVAVRRGEEVLDAWTIEAAGDYGATVAATLVFAEALRARHAADPGRVGVIGPEDLCTLADLRPAFEARGLRLMRRIS
jgi:hypothetical protein